MSQHYPYPVFLRLEDKPCLVAGGGNVAYRKALDLVECGARVTVVAETPSPEVAELAESGRITLVRRRFRPEDLAGMFLVFAATDDRVVNADIAEQAHGRGILVNAVDDPERCDFISGAVVKQGPLRIAVSTSGCGPLIASRIRGEIEERYSESFGTYVTLAGEIREFIISEERDEERKREALACLADEEMYHVFLRCGKERVWERIRKILTSL
ncbi:MAG: precorrin-2 dehydrogenase/sirohydrochlorin ferrochelatase family protein [Candidatus Latescibacterota bacterium]